VTGTVLGALFLRLVIDAINRIIDSSADKPEGMIVGVVVVLAVTFTQLRDLMHSGRRFFPGWQGVFSILAIAIAGTMLAMMFSTYITELKPHGGAVGAITFAVLGLGLAGVKYWESRRDRVA
jgi:hypothetical protein